MIRTSFLLFLTFSAICCAEETNAEETIEKITIRVHDAWNKDIVGYVIKESGEIFDMVFAKGIKKRGSQKRRSSVGIRLSYRATSMSYFNELSKAVLEIKKEGDISDNFEDNEYTIIPDPTVIRIKITTEEKEYEYTEIAGYPSTGTKRFHQLLGEVPRSSR